MEETRDHMNRTGPAETDEAGLIAAMNGYRDVLGLEPGEYLRVHDDILVPYGRTLSEAMRAAIRAYLASLPTPPNTTT